MAELALPATGGGDGVAAAPVGARRSWPARAFVIVTWGLTFHIVAMTVLFAVLRLDTVVVRAIALWKELAIVLLLLAAVLRAMTRAHGGVVLGAADFAAMVLVGSALVHAVAMAAGAGPDFSGPALVYGLRDTVFFVIPLALGRLTPELFADSRPLRHLFLVGVVTSAIAVVEWLVVTPQMLVVLGVGSYFSDFLGVAAFTVDNEFGLPTNYWTVVGGQRMQRAGSVHLSSQGFAIPFLVIIPAATVWMNMRRRWASPVMVAAFALTWLGLLLSITRMTVTACLLATLAVILLARRPGPLVGVGVAGVVVFALLLLAVPGLAGFVWETLLWQTGSSASHGRDYANGLAAVWERPLGNGLGTSDMTAVRLGLTPITGDNLYLKLAVELGLPAALAFITILGVFLWRGARAALTAPTARLRAAGAFLAAASVGVAANGMTAVLTNAPIFSLLFFWLAGSALATIGEGDERALH